MRVCRGRGSGFTLIEVLVVIGIVALIVGITIPAMASVRVRAGGAKSLANLHGIALSVQMYQDQYRVYPFIEHAQELVFTPPDQAPALRVGIAPQWDIARYWPCVMHGIAPWREHFGTWISPGLEREKGREWLAVGSAPGDSGTSIDPSYRYSNSCIATPGVWGGGGDEVIAARRSDMVVSPSAKVLMFDADMAYLKRASTTSDARPVLMADSSGVNLKDAQASEPVQNRLRTVPPARYHDTAGGLGGRDK